MTYPTSECPQPNEELLKIAGEQGEQTTITENVKRIADEIDPENKLKGIELVKEVCTYVMTLIPDEEELDEIQRLQPNLKIDKRRRTADQLLDQSNLLPRRMRVRNISGCIETGHIVRAILLAKGIPCIYTETLQKDWCEKYAPYFEIDNPKTPPMQGHVFIDVFLVEENKRITVDPSGGKEMIHDYQDYNKNGNQYSYARSAKDSYDLGYKSMRTFQEAVVNYFKTKN